MTGVGNFSHSVTEGEEEERAVSIAAGRLLLYEKAKEGVDAKDGNPPNYKKEVKTYHRFFTPMHMGL